MHVRPLQHQMAQRIDELFYHRYERTVRKNATVSWEGLSFEVNHALVSKKVELIVNPHTKTALRVESKSGEDLGPVVLLDLTANLHRRRQRPNTDKDSLTGKQDEYAVEDAYRDFIDSFGIPLSEFVVEEQ